MASTRRTRNSAAAAKATPTSSDTSVVAYRTPRTTKRKAAEQPTPPPAKRSNRKSKARNRTPQDFSKAPPKYHGKLSNSMLECKKIVDTFYGNRMEKFEIFYAPVDVEALNLPDYYDIVETPMDLQTVKEKLEHLQYATAEEFAEDMRLIANNCLKYNGENSTYGKTAKEFLKSFEWKYERLPADRQAKKHIKAEPTFAASVPSNMSLKAVAASSSSSAKKVQAAAPSADDDQIESWIQEVDAVNETLKKQLEEGQNLKKELYNLKVARMNTKRNGEAALQLSEEHLSRLEAFLAKSNSTAAPTAIKSSAAAARSKMSSSSASAETKPVAVVAPQVQVDIAAAETEAPTPRKGRKKGSKNKKKKDGYTFNSDDEGNQEDITFEEKRQLSLKIGQLSEDTEVLVKVINIIKSREELADTNSEEIEIDFETLKPVTLRELDAFVAAVMKKKNPKPKRTRRPAGTKVAKKKQQPEEQSNASKDVPKDHGNDLKDAPEDQSNGSKDVPEEPSTAEATSNQEAKVDQSLVLSESSSSSSSEDSGSEASLSDDEMEPSKDVGVSTAESKSASEVEAEVMMPLQKMRSFVHSHPARLFPPSNNENLAAEDKVEKQQKVSPPPPVTTTTKPRLPATSQANAMIDPLAGLLDDSLTDAVIKNDPFDCLPDEPMPTEKPAVSESEKPEDLGKSIELMANFDADF